MKKLLVKILTCLLFTSLLVFNSNHAHQIHAAEYEIYCDQCGERITDYTVRQDATCTSTGSAYCRCSNQNCPGINPTTSNYSFAYTILALGHDYQKHVVTEATCLTAGKIEYKCSRCADKYTNDIPATSHNYIKKTIINVTCEIDGLERYTCSNCEDAYDIVVKALEHDYQKKEHVDPTCTKDGHITTICINCKDEKIDVLKALGHKLPEEWTTEKKATIFHEGQESKTCFKCNEIITQVIPKVEILSYVPIGVGSVSFAAIAFIALKKVGKIGAKKALEKASKEIVEDATEEIAKEEFNPSFEEKTIVTCLNDETFYRTLKIQKYLVVVESEYDDIKESIKENEPSLTIIDVSDKDLNEGKEKIKTIKNELEEVDVVISLLVSREQLNNNKDLLEEMKSNKLIKDYGLIETNASVNLVKLVLPVMKPELKSDESLENIGMVADALGIPSISTIIDIYISGREIKETVDEGKEEGLGFVDKATIISDIASILGLDTVSSVVGLVGDVDDIKSSLEAKIGGNEVKTTKDAISDIIEVVSDIVDK